MIVAAELTAQCWYGHPEALEAARAYDEAKNAEGDAFDHAMWFSRLTCWYLLDEQGLRQARAYEPTEKTPRWVFTDRGGDREIAPPVSMERLVALQVQYRLKGGLDVDALHV